MYTLQRSQCQLYGIVISASFLVWSRCQTVGSSQPTEAVFSIELTASREIAFFCSACRCSFHSHSQLIVMSGIRKGSARKPAAAAAAAPGGKKAPQKAAGAKSGGGGGGKAKATASACFAGCGLRAEPEGLIQHYEKVLGNNEPVHIQALSDKVRRRERTAAAAVRQLAPRNPLSSTRPHECAAHRCECFEFRCTCSQLCCRAAVSPLRCA